MSEFTKICVEVEERLNTEISMAAFEGRHETIVKFDTKKQVSIALDKLGPAKYERTVINTNEIKISW